MCLLGAPGARVQAGDATDRRIPPYEKRAVVYNLRTSGNSHPPRFVYTLVFAPAGGLRPVEAPGSFLMEQESMRVQFGWGRRALAAAASVWLSSASVFGQAGQPAPATPPTQTVQPAAPATPSTQAPTPAAPSTQAAQPPAANVPGRPLTIDEAVRLALEQNLGVQVERLNPELQQLAITQARTAWTPVLSGGFTGRNQNTPPNSFLSGAANKISQNNIGGNAQIEQLLPFGTSYVVTYDTSRATTNSVFSAFNPQLSGDPTASVVQPLLRWFSIDAFRLQLQTAQKNREIADVALQETIATTIRTVKNAYWDYKYALASLDVARQSLALAQESLRNTRSRVEIGTLAPIDVVEAESEVAQRVQAVILAEAAIGQSEDTLRSLIFDPKTSPDLWNQRLDPTDPVPFQAQTLDVNGAVMRALRERTDLIQSRKALERTGFNERYFRNQTLPDLNLRLDYNSTAVAGRQAITDPNADTFPPPVIGSIVRPYGDLLADVFRSEFPTWTFSVNVSYPLGTSSAEASLARTRLERQQEVTSLRNLELVVTTQVRNAARQLMANSQRVDATRAARVLAERRLEAEEKKFAAGMSTSFLVFQAQRDLSEARNNELRAVLDYTQSQVDYDTVQVAPVSGGASFLAGAGGFTTTTGGTSTAAGGAVAGAGAGGVAGGGAAGGGGPQ
jgi:outer membrane protein